MKLYPKGSWGLLSQLINESNPGLTVDLTKDNTIVLEKPNINNLGNSSRNSRIRINGSSGSGIQGKAELFYDRISLNVLFRYPISITAASNVKKLSDLIPDLNEFLGITLVKEDLAEPDKPTGYGYEEGVLDINISLDSFCYRGKIQLLWSRRPAGVYPDSGPGTKVLRIGDLTEGYFGMVPGSEMVTVGDIYREATYGTGLTPTVTTTINWLKFALDGEFYFFPTKAPFTDLSWNNIKEIGGIRGERTEPFICKHPEKVYHFIPTLPIISKNDPTLLDKKDPTSTAARIFDKLHRSTNGTGEWEARSDIIVTEPFWWMNSKAVDGEVKPAFYTDFRREPDNASGKNAKGHWRPMLRVVDPNDYRYRLRNFKTSLVGVLTAPTLIIDPSVRDEDMVVRVYDVGFLNDANNNAPLLSLSEEPPKLINSLGVDTTIAIPPMLSLSGEPPKLINSLSVVTTAPVAPACYLTIGDILVPIKDITSSTSFANPIINSIEAIFREVTDLSSSNGELGLFD